MEGVVHTGTDASAFKECFALTWKNPYVLRLAFSAGIGGLLFGYDTGSFSFLTLTLILYKHVLVFWVLKCLASWYCRRDIRCFALHQR